MNRPHLYVAVLGIAAMLLAPAATFAQTAPAPVAAPAGHAARHHQHGSRYMHALRSLNLSDAQRGQIRGYVRSSAQQLRTQIDGVLTPAQRAQLKSTMQRSRPAAKPAT